MDNKLRVAVLMGGRSIEHEVSFNSGRTICDHLDTAYYTVIPLFQTSSGKLYLLPWHFLHRGKIADFEHRLAGEAQEISWDDLKELIDFVYIALHGRYAEDGSIQAMLELLSIPYLGSKLRASALGMHKIVQKNILKINNIRTPNGFALYIQDIEQILDQNKLDKFNKIISQKLEDNNLKFPVIVKPAFEGSSFGVSLAKDLSELRTAIHTASNIDSRQPQPVVIEEQIKGMEFSCIVITDKKTGQLMPLPPTEIVLEEGSYIFDYVQKYMPGRAHKFTPARCSENIIKKIQDTCVQVMQALEISNIGRIDGFVTREQEIVIIDPNTLSGAAPTTFPFRQAAEINMSHTQFINHLIETELITYGLKMEENYNWQDSQKLDRKKIRVGVILGGRSAEREISLESGRNVFYKLSPHKYSAKALFLDESLELYELNQSLLVRNKTSEIAEGLKPEFKIKWSKLPELFDFIFIALHGGEGENGVVQGTLETLGLPYNGSGILASSICMDKYKTNQYLNANGIDIPKNIFLDLNKYKAAQELRSKELNREQVLEDIIKTIGFPLIVKPYNDGCSVLVSKVTNKDELIKSLELIMLSGRSHALIEEFITGMELTVGVIGNDYAYALPPSYTRASQAILSIEEKFLPGAGENQTPAPLDNKILNFVRNIIADAYTILGCKGYSRIDCFYQTAEQSPTGKERVVIIEVNTLPALTPATCIFHQASEVDIKPMDFVDLIVKLGLQEHKSKHSLELDLNNGLNLDSYPKLKIESQAS